LESRCIYSPIDVFRNVGNGMPFDIASLPRRHGYLYEGILEYLFKTLESSAHIKRGLWNNLTTTYTEM
jgi:hypothetical protein